ncbi:MAG: pseudouridine synthase, partial [Rikenellaceae bacterium]
MRDFKKDSSANNVSRFGRDRRAQSGTGENRREERRPRSQRDAADSDNTRTERRSFNPNFSRDNRPNEGGERKSYGDRKPFGEKKQYGESKPYGDRKPYGEKKQYGESKPYGDRKPYGEKKQY